MHALSRTEIKCNTCMKKSINSDKTEDNMAKPILVKWKKSYEVQPKSVNEKSDLNMSSNNHSTIVVSKTNGDIAGFSP